MKKLLVVEAVMVFTMSLTSCDPETVSDDQLYEQNATGKGDTSSGGDK